VLPQATKKNIVICGYPKSGTTWLSRLVGELLPCPLVGPLGFAPAAAREGHERISEYDSYTSHHTFESLRSGQIGDFFKLIYIVRDPRDVAISAAHHFQVDLLAAQRASSKVVAALKRRVNRVVPYFVKRERMINAVLRGDSSLSLWLATPWREHYLQFRQSDALMVRYEDLLDDPATKCLQILSYLGIERPNESIAQAISNQSFQTRKRFFKAQGSTAEYKFLRRGSYGYWRDELSPRQKQLFVDELGNELAALSYSLD
jgi:Sulfotransferase domain